MKEGTGGGGGGERGANNERSIQARCGDMGIEDGRIRSGASWRISERK